MTFSQLVSSLILSETLSIPHWIPFLNGRAIIAQSKERRIRRWIANHKIIAHEIYSPVIQAALAGWMEGNRMYIAFDTCMLWNRFCMLRISVVYRGRAIALDWRVLAHKSAAVSFEAYADFLRGIPKLLPPGVTVVFLADRGFADVQLMKLCHDELRWHYRIRVKEGFHVYFSDGTSKTIGQLMPKKRRFRTIFNIHLTDQHYGLVHLALGKHGTSQENWIIVSDQKTRLKTFKEYGKRFDIEEEFLDDKSNGFQLESSKIRNASDLERLLLILATAKLVLVVQGQTVVEQGKRRWVDPHWTRGYSYLKIGWKWIVHALLKGWKLVQSLKISGKEDPEPVVVSKKQMKARQKRAQLHYAPL